MMIRGKKDDLIQALVKTHAEQGKMLTDVKITRNGGWLGRIVNASNPNQVTIQVFLAKIDTDPDYNKHAVTRLINSLELYFSKKGLTGKSLQTHMYSADAEVVRNIRMEEFLSLRSTGKGTWDFLQSTIKKHLPNVKKM